MTTPPDSPTPRAGLPAAQAWGLVGFMWFAFLINYCDRQVVFSIFPLLEKEMGFSTIEQGLTGSVFLWVYGLSNPIAGQAGDFFSKRRLVLAALILWSVCTWATAYSTTAMQMLILRGIIGISEAMFYPAAVALTANAHDPRTRSRALACFGSAQIIGTVAGGWLGGYMGKNIDWRFAFYLLGLTGVAYSIPFLFFLRRIPDAVRVETRAARSNSGLLEVLKVPSFYFIALAMCSFVFVQWLLNSWLSKFLFRKFHLDLEQAAFDATAYVQLPTLVGMLIAGVLADALYRLTRTSRSWMVAGGLLTCLPFLIWIGRAGSLSGTLMAESGFGFFSGFLIANIMASSFEVVPSNARASAVGLLNLGSGLVAGFGTMAGGLFKQQLGQDQLVTGLGGLFVISAAVCLVVGALLIASIRYLFRRDFDRVH